jgi:DNA-binding IclR family transcriptional regulator
VALNELHLATGAVVHLSVLEGGMAHYLDKVGGAAAATVPSRVGARIVASDTVSGRSMLAFIAPEQVDVMIRAARGGNVEDIDLVSLHRELAAVRQRQGLAISSGEHRSTGITSIGAPVLGPGGPVASVSVAARGPIAVGAVAPLVLRAARAVSRNLDPEWFVAQHARTRIG